MNVAAARIRNVDWQDAVIERMERRAVNLKSFFLRPRKWLSLRAGQHLDIRLTAADGYQTQRSYSIASAPGLRGYYELIVERLDDGEVSPFLHDIAAIDDTIEVRGPFGGHFVWGIEDGGPLLLVGAGSGVAPLLSILRHRAEIGGRVPITLLYAARRWDDVIYRQELITRDATESDFTLLLSLSMDVARRSQDFSRRIDSSVVRAALATLSSVPRIVFVCGSNPFVTVVIDYLLDLGILPQTIRAERYGGELSRQP